MKKFALCLALLAACLCLNAQDSGGFVTKHARMDRSRINIGTYHLAPYARTDAHIKDLAECGIDYVMYMN
ncbi:MAG: hypothetical protein II963_05380, partial [Bacteroidales bacterium]|nr:hypothetical protein [Bacteroidales bacterium]